MLKRLAVLVAALVAVIAIWWLWFAAPLTKTALLQSKGENTAPKYFSVPRDINEAIKKLNELGFRSYSVEVSDHCIFHELERPTEVYVFADDSWRQGTFCIVPKGNEISEIYWLFQPGAP